ncbi:MAG TPA: type VI secretion system tube protein Hcp [Solirubrobacteraceae bacterium]|nr:type VI secretion system tube protein Hcp [Solirubrobacteraceae bacterium]
MNDDVRRDDAPKPRRVWRHVPVSWKVVVPTAAALFCGIGGAVAAASIPGSNGVITGCYVTPAGVSNEDSDQPVGSLRVIDPSDSTDDIQGVNGCTTGEAEITWNQQGQTGPAGQNGQNGANGQNGQNGLQGPQGPQGPAGGVSAQSGTGTDVIMELTPTNANLGGLTPVGESVQSPSTNQIFDLDSFDLGADNSVNLGSQSTGAGAGKATFQKFVVTKPVDKYSSDLFEDLVKGTFLKSAEIIVREPGHTGMSIPVAQYLMKDVAITDIHVSGGSKTATETIQGEYAAIQFVIYEQNANGTTKVGSTGGWSQVTNSDAGVTPVGGVTSKRHRRR